MAINMTRHRNGIGKTTLGFITLAGLATVAGCSPSQPRVQCTVSRATFGAKYTLVSGTGDCKDIKGETLGVQAYVPDKDANEGKGSWAITGKSMSDAIGVAEEAGIEDEDETHADYGIGNFKELLPDANDFCYVDMMSAAEIKLDAVPTAMPPAPAYNAKYQWSKMRTLVTAAQTGVQFEGELEYTDIANNCSAKFKVQGVSPSVSCDDGMGRPDADLCNANPDPTTGFAGSGISPDIAVVCDEELLLCVPSKPFPSMN